jgi:hypothetical protein
MRIAFSAICFALAVGVAPVGAQTTTETEASSTESTSTATLDEVLVTGEQPGPSLWRVSKSTPNGEHVLWILGSHGPLPKKIFWRSKSVEATIADSQELIANSSFKADVGFFTGIFLLPSLIGIRNNPNDVKLKDTVPPELYARWLVLKEKYIGRDSTVEKWRPIFAAQELYSKAIEKSDLAPGRVWVAVEKIAKKNDVKITRPQIPIEVEKPRTMIKEFKKTELSDLDCFAKTIERLETDLDVMRARANAWATGNVKALREMTYVDQVSACIEAVLNAQMVQERGYQDMPARLATAWLAAVDTALDKNHTTFAVMQINELLKPDGYVSKLRAKGYHIDEP